MNALRKLALFTTLVLALLALAAALPATAAAQDNTAVAVNLEDGENVFDFAFTIRRVMGDVVDEQNAAVAYSSCEDCQTVAVAIQVVLVFSDPSVITPENYAIAVNEECDTCVTVASAYQIVVGVPEGFRFSTEAWRRIVEIRLEIMRLGREFERGELDALDLQARIDALVDELRDVIRADVEAGGATQGKKDDAPPELPDDDAVDTDEGEEPEQPEEPEDVEESDELEESDTTSTETTPETTTTTP